MLKFGGDSAKQVSSHSSHLLPFSITQWEFDSRKMPLCWEENIVISKRGREDKIKQ